jgi:hypothetical protein
VSTTQDLRRLLEDYRALAVKGWEKPALQLRLVDIKPDPLVADAAAYELVKSAISGTNSGKGWARLRSAVYPTGTDDRAFPDFAENGPPLHAEWIESDSVSVHLRPAPGGGLVKRTYAERSPGSGPEAGGIPALREIVSVLRHGHDDRVLDYHVFWGAPADDPSALRRLFARFAGFRREDRIRQPNERVR